jgi:putative PIN family toxin of toxin-antitoxin system
VRIVVDTNVLVSGIFWGGKPAAVLGHWRSGTLDVLATIDILEEYLRVIAKVGKREPQLVEHWTNFLTQHLMPVEKTVTIRDCRDPDDNKFLECAVSAGADCVVSGDDDLLVLGRVQGLFIHSVSEFLSTHFA